MPQTEKKEQRLHSLTIENREKLRATGISDVDGFDENSVFAVLPDRTMTIRGKKLKVTAFSAETGDLSVDGEIDSVAYTAALSRKAGLFARVFK